MGKKNQKRMRQQKNSRAYREANDHRATIRVEDKKSDPETLEKLLRNKNWTEAEEFFKRQILQGHSYFDTIEVDKLNPLLPIWSYPIHKWISRGAPLSVIQRIVEKDPYAIFRTDEMNRNAMAVACQIEEAGMGAPKNHGGIHQVKVGNEAGTVSVIKYLERCGNETDRPSDAEGLHQDNLNTYNQKHLHGPSDHMPPPTLQPPPQPSEAPYNPPNAPPQAPILPPPAMAQPPPTYPPRPTNQQLYRQQNDDSNKRPRLVDIPPLVSGASEIEKRVAGHVASFMSTDRLSPTQPTVPAATYQVPAEIYQIALSEVEALKQRLEKAEADYAKEKEKANDMYRRLREAEAVINGKNLDLDGARHDLEAYMETSRTLHGVLRDEKEAAMMQADDARKQLAQTKLLNEKYQEEVANATKRMVQATKQKTELNNRKNEEIEEIHEQNANALTRLSAAHATEINAALELIIRVRDVNSKKEAFKEVGAAHGISADKQAIRKLLNEKNQAIWAKKNTVGGVGALAAGNGDVKIEGGGAQKIKVEPGAATTTEAVQINRDLVGTDGNRDDECTICMHIAQRSRSLECSVCKMRICMKCIEENADSNPAFKTNCQGGCGSAGEGKMRKSAGGRTDSAKGGPKKFDNVLQVTEESDSDIDSDEEV